MGTGAGGAAGGAAGAAGGAGSNLAGMGMGGAVAAAGMGGAGGMIAAGFGGIGVGGMGMGGAGGTLPPVTNSTMPDLKVAFTGDMAVRPGQSDEVLKLIKRERAHLVLHAGDLGYGDGPVAFENQLNSVLGDTYPYFYSVGNHDTGNQGWSTYQQNMQKRLDKIPEASCTGDLGVRSTCTYQGLMFILSGVGTVGNTMAHNRYISNELSKSDQLWEICDWHKNHTDMQVGGKSTEVEAATYKACLDGGAIVATAHEHSYGRTFTLTNFRGRPYGKMGPPDMLTLSEGSTFVFHSGIGGSDIRVFRSHGNNSWWATIYTSDRFVMNGMRVNNFSANFGALFITFHVNGNPRSAEGYFKTISNDTIDRFTVTNMKP
ncbi:MAG: metallophosphoesterase [Proteobacteria bacterium]|nr:metallophosphoesterase [Pseudomonadota bacterium]